MEKTIDPAKSNVGLTKRQQWLLVLAQEKEALLQYEAALKQSAYQFIRAAEIGMVMVRGKTAGQGQVFNLGETTVSRCAVRLDSGETGFGYVVGRNKAQAELMALADALLQSKQHAHWMQHLIKPLAARYAQRQKQKRQRIAQTKVDFFTMVRGED